MNEQANSGGRTNEQRTPAGTTGRAPGSRALNEIIRADGSNERPSRDIPDAIAKHYTRGDSSNAYKSAHMENKIEFVDRGNRMHAYHPISTFTTRSMVEIAEHRGWKELTVTGSEKFRQGAYIEAATRGIEVHGYKPTEKDTEILQRREDRKAAADNPMVKAFLEADTGKARTAAAKQHPQLAEAFKVDAAVKAFAAEKLDSKKSEANFVGRFRDSIAIALHTGRALPSVNVDQGKEQKAPEPKAEQGRSR